MQWRWDLVPPVRWCAVQLPFYWWSAPVQPGEENAKLLRAGGEVGSAQLDPVIQSQPPPVREGHDVLPVAIGVTSR